MSNIEMERNKVEVLLYIDKGSPLYLVLGHRCYFIPGVAHLFQSCFHISPPGVFGPSSFLGGFMDHIGHVRP